jgi:hypothetical protein
MRNHSNDIILVGHVDTSGNKMIVARFESDPGDGDGWPNPDNFKG